MGRDLQVNVLPRARKPGPCGGGDGNTVLKLRFREIGGLLGRTMPPRSDAAFYAEKTRRFKLKEECDVCAGMEFPPRATRSITSITVANDIILALDWQGFCVAFRQNANGSISPYERYGLPQHLNHNGERIEIVFYNKINESIMVVFSVPTLSGYYTRAIPLESIRSDNWDDGVLLFGPQANILPFFDECNHIAVVSPSLSAVLHNIYEMSTYNIVHTIFGKIHSITKRPGILIVGYKQMGNYLPIAVFSTENWSVLKNMDYYIPPFKRLEFIDICNEKILLKQRNNNMQIVDIWNHDNVTVIEQTKHLRHYLCFDLTANNLLLKLDNDKIIICNSRGEQVSLLEDNEVTGCKSRHRLSNTYVTTDVNYAIFYSSRSIEKPREGGTGIQGSITYATTSMESPS